MLLIGVQGEKPRAQAGRQQRRKRSGKKDGGTGGTPEKIVSPSNPSGRASGRLPHPSRTPHFVGCVFFCDCTGSGHLFCQHFPAAGCRTRVAHPTPWGMFSFAPALKRAFFCGLFPSDGAWSQFALWTFLKQVPARSAFFCGANPIVLGLGATRILGSAFYFAYSPVFMAGGLLGGASPAASRRFQDLYRPPWEAFLAPAERFLKARGKPSAWGLF